MSATTSTATNFKIAFTTRSGNTIHIIAIIRDGKLYQSRLSTAAEQPVGNNFVATTFRVKGVRDSYVLQPGFRLSGLLAKPEMVKAMYPALYPFFDFK